MKKNTLLYIWAGMYVLCGLLSLISAPSAPLRVVMVVLSLAFFAPPVLLRIQNEEKTNRLVRLISAISLAATFLMLLINILASLAATEIVGNALHYLLLAVSVPGVCCGSYGLSLFLWACLLFSTLKGRK